MYTSKPSNIDHLHSVYLIGIKGAAMTALAEILAQRGVKITGSDTQETFFTDQLLKKINAQVWEKFSKANVQRIAKTADIIIHSTAYNSQNNPEVAFAKEKDLPLLNYPEALALLFNKEYGLAVAGTHGKTTTTALLAQILKTAGADPTALVGSQVKNWDSASLVGKSRYFVIEADEYQNKLKYYRPQAAVITNIDYDHPDFFPNKRAYLRVFQNFTRKIPRAGFLVYNLDDPEVRKVAQSARCQIISFGFGKKETPDWKIQKRTPLKTGGQKITVACLQKKVAFKKITFELPLNGSYNALNATAALAAAAQLNISAGSIKKAFAGFQSTKRRFEKMGSLNQGLLFDDYAHHPREVQAILKAVRERYPRRKILAAFHPHTFSRTQAFFDKFAQSLTLADEVFVLDVYASAREKPADFRVDSRKLAALINQKEGQAKYVPTLQKLAPIIRKKMNSRTLFISLGAGDVWKIHQKLGVKL